MRKLTIAVVALALISGCVVTKPAVSRAERLRYLEANPELPETIKKAIRSGKIVRGMGIETMLAVFGPTRQLPDGRWLYSNSRDGGKTFILVTFENNVVSKVQENVTPRDLAVQGISLGPSNPKVFGAWFDLEAVKHFNEETTADDVVKKLKGAPLRADWMDDGTVVWTYHYSIPTANRVESKTVVLTLKENKLVKYEIIYLDQIITGLGNAIGGPRSVVWRAGEPTLASIEASVKDASPYPTKDEGPRVVEGPISGKTYVIDHTRTSKPEGYAEELRQKNRLDYIEEHPDLPPQTVDAIRKGTYHQGMTAEQVRVALQLTTHPTINRTVGSWGVREQWALGTRTLYFENGVLTSWQETE